MNLEKAVSDAFGLDDEGWARHANPLSGWSRVFTGLPLLVLAIWSRVWLGWWALVPVAIALIWVVVNPKLFAPASSDESYISKAVLGERFWTRRAEFPIPSHHVVPIRLLNGIAAAGAVPLIWGLVVLDIWILLFGVAVAWGGKMWFLDRMVWLYQDNVAREPTLRYRRPGA